MADEPPIAVLRSWLGEADRAGVSHPWAATFVTSSLDGSPSARAVTLKRLEPGSLVFTSALWTRKVSELMANPKVAVSFHWPDLGRQALVTGVAAEGDRDLAEELFAERGRDHQLQAHVSRQGQEIDSLEPLRQRHLALSEDLDGQPVPCPDDWGVILVEPQTVEFWAESPDRLHERIEHYRADGAWTKRQLAP